MVRVAATALLLLSLLLVYNIADAATPCTGTGCPTCGTSICFEIDGILDDAPIEDLKKCSSCGAEPTCGPCTTGINGWVCRPAGQPSCVGCNVDCCGQCIFAGVNNTRYCGSLIAREWTLNEVTDLVSEVDKLSTVISLTATSQTWVDVLQSVADVQGSDSFELLTAGGTPVASDVLAVQQAQYLDTIAQRDNIVWSTSSSFQDNGPSSATEFASAFNADVFALWTSKSNTNLIPPRSAMLAATIGVDLTSSPPPILPLISYKGVCKQATCRGTPGGSVGVPVVGGPGSLPGGINP